MGRGRDLSAWHQGKAGQMLPLYAREFPITELNYTWYQMPRAEA
jgi:hypothetical protein